MSTLAEDGLPPLREVIAEHGLSARKSLGQNFLLDLNLTRKVARASGPLDGAEVVEIGPGPGGLTRALLAEGASHVLAIERDPRCIPALEQIAKHYPGRLTIIEGDAMEVDPTAHTGADPRIVANLPYNVGTQLLVGWLTPDEWPPWWTSLTLMFQREVAERIVAKPGGKAYGRLSVLAQLRAKARIAFDVPPQAFTPPPKVTSSVVHVAPAAAPEGVSIESVARLTAAAFGQRRKMLRQSLKQVTSDPRALLDRAGIPETARAETLDLDAFIRLSRELNG